MILPMGRSSTGPLPSVTEQRPSTAALSAASSESWYGDVVLAARTTVMILPMGRSSTVLCEYQGSLGSLQEGRRLSQWFAGGGCW